MNRLRTVLDGRHLSPEERLRVGWPRGLALLFVVLPALIAGPIRFCFGISLGPAFIVATLLSLLLLSVVGRALRIGVLTRWQEIVAHAVLFAVGLFAGALTYNRHFHGLPQYVADERWMAIDGAYHLMNYMDFTRRSHDVYGGFVSMYSFWDATRRLGSTHLLVGLNVCFAFVRIFAAVVPCTIAFTAVYRFRDDVRAWSTAAATCVVCAFAVQYLVVLPLLNFHLMGGFWPHLFGVVPTMMLWAADALVRQRLLRLVALLAGVVLYRYTYGLNLADLCAAIGALLIFEALDRRPVPRLVRGGLVLVSMAAFLASRHCFTLTIRLYRDWGWIVEHDVALAENGQLLALFAFTTSLWLWPARSATGNGVARLLRFPICFSGANLVLLALIKRIPPGTYYYFQKYDLHALVLAAGALVVVVTFWTAACVRRFSWATGSGLVLVLLLGGASIVELHRSVANFQGAFDEQVYNAPYLRSRPWVMPATVRRIERTLASAKGKPRFGGYLSRHWPMLIATNALFDHGDRDWTQSPTLDSTPGHCVFWDGDRYPDLDLRPEKSCEAYFQAPFGSMSLCSACY